MERSLVRPTIFALALALAAATTSPVLAQDDEEWMPAPIPDSIRMAILADAGDGDQVAWKRLGDSGYVLSYLRGPTHCGSGGCRARVWREGPDGAVEISRLPVGHLPIVALDEANADLPTIGVTASGGGVDEPAIVPAYFDGETYSDGDWDNRFPLGSGSVLLDEDRLGPVSRLKPTQNAGTPRGFGPLPRDYGNYCTGSRGDDWMFFWDIGDEQATIRFNGEIRYLKVPMRFTSPDAGSTDSPFNNTQWLAKDLALQFYDIAPSTGGMAGPESDGFNIYTVSMTGVGAGHFDRIEMQVHCGL